MWPVEKMSPLLILGIVLGVLLLLWCIREPPAKPLVGLDLMGGDLLVVLLDGSERGGDWCLETVRACTKPERVRLGVVQRRSPQSQNIVRFMRRYNRMDVLVRTRVTLVPPEATRRDVLEAVRKDIHNDEPRVLLVTPDVVLAKGWDDLLGDLPLDRGVYTAGMDGDKPIFPMVDVGPHDLPLIEFLPAAGSLTQASGEVPFIAPIDQCLAVSDEVFHKIMEAIPPATPDWIMDALIGSTVHGLYLRLFHAPLISAHRPVLLPRAKTAYSVSAMRQALNPLWVRFAGVGTPRGLLGITSEEDETGWRWKWGDSNAQDAAKEAVQWIDDQ
jgi:hypothetical protein